MRNRHKGIIAGLFLFGLSLTVWAAGIPHKIQQDQLQLGQGASTDNKVIEFNTGDSAFNVKLQVDDSRNGSLSTNQLTLGEGDAANKRVILDRGGSNAEIRWNEGTSRLEFSNDGSAFDNIGADDQTGDFASLNENIGLDTSVAANVLTIDLVQKDGSTDPTSPSPVKIAFRSSTLTNGGYVIQTVIAALTMDVSSGATLGHRDGVDEPIYVYALDNAGTVELAVSRSLNFSELDRHSTTIMSATSDDANTLYSTVARTDVGISLLGRLISNQATAGTYASTPTEEAALTGPLMDNRVFSSDITGHTECAANIESAPSVTNQTGNCVTGTASIQAGEKRITLDTNLVSVNPMCTCTALSTAVDGNFDITCGIEEYTTGNLNDVVVITENTGTGSREDHPFTLKCSLQ